MTDTDYNNVKSPLYDGPKEKRYWRHEPGDEYAVILSRIVGGQERGYTTQHTMVYPKYEYLTHARQAGFRLGESDDFNIGVWRGGRLAAMLWMRQIVDDDAKLMDAIAAEIGAPQ